MSQRREPARPFFAFLNYFDAHSVYLLPPGTPYRFGRPPKTEADVQVFVDWFYLDKLRLPPYYVNLARDCYDSCLGYLDEQLGELFDELKRRGVLDRTLVIVTSDHGEGLGEHNLFFHGETLYRTEIRVPLLIVLPGHNRSVIVSETVSLRDLPATIVDLTGQGTGAPFPGRSLARLWRDSRPGDPSPPGKERSRNWRVPIRMIRIKGGRPFIGARWPHSPKAITSTFAMKVTAARSSSTSAMIRMSLTIGLGSRPRKPSRNGFGRISTR